MSIVFCFKACDRSIRIIPMRNCDKFQPHPRNFLINTLSGFQKHEKLTSDMQIARLSLINPAQLFRFPRTRFFNENSAFVPFKWDSAAFLQISETQVVMNIATRMNAKCAGTGESCKTGEEEKITTREH